MLLVSIAIACKGNNKKSEHKKGTQSGVDKKVIWMEVVKVEREKY